MDLEELRVQLEEDLSWRFDELRMLRNRLLQGAPPTEWSAGAMRAILVMQYAHLEGFTELALGLYVRTINEAEVHCKDLKPEVAALHLAREFQQFRGQSGTTTDPDEEEENPLLNRAKRETRFVAKIKDMINTKFHVLPEDAVKLEMNLGSRVLKKSLYVLGIDSRSFSRETFGSLEFVRRSRNDIAHGKREERISPGEFQGHRIKCEQYMNDLVRVIAEAVRSETYKAPISA